MIPALDAKGYLPSSIDQLAIKLYAVQLLLASSDLTRCIHVKTSVQRDWVTDDRFQFISQMHRMH